MGMKGTLSQLELYTLCANMNANGYLLHNFLEQFKFSILLHFAMQLQELIFLEFELEMVELWPNRHF